MKKTLRTIIILAILVGLVGGYYYYVNNQTKTAGQEDVELSETDKILLKDFENDYPSSPRAVVKWYSRISMVLYNREYEDDQYEAIADQMRCILDEDLLGYNPRETFLKNLQSEIDEYETYDRSIVRAEYPDSSEVEYKTIQGDECAYLTVEYFGKEASNYVRTYQRFCLRKDAEGHWKILTFEKVSGDDE